ncbi:MAG: hypothetical protein DRN05_05890 [Thermoplasmata archaeon]|nr:MAG: hypothetical protein DRN05_05890 [Thermoplasmata archaeon]
MNPFFNPLLSISFLKNYILDPGRTKRLTPSQIERYRDRSLRRILSYAYTVPVYRKKYRQIGLHIQEITEIKDIKKLPFISKQDLRNGFPDEIVPEKSNKKKFYIVSTGGTTGRPISIYTDLPTMLRGITITLREMKYFKLNLRKTKIAHIGNFSRYRIDHVFQEKLMKHLKPFYSMKNTLNIDVNQPIKTIMHMLNNFKPDLIISYPAVFQHLAFLKRKGYGKNVNPKLLQVGGAILDEYTRSYVEDTFRCRLLNIYSSVEAGANIAFECPEGNWHIHHDFFHVEAVDKNMEPVTPGERGHIVITRLWGRGTPIIRYTGMDDWVTLSDNKKCSCGLQTPLFETPVEGRKRATIVLPNGKIFPPGAFCFISSVLHDLKTYKIKQYQIIQKRIDEIEILLVIDEDLRDKPPSFEEISNAIEKVYRTKVGPDVKIIIKEVKEIKGDPNSDKPPQIVVSHVKPEDGYKFI